MKIKNYKTQLLFIVVVILISLPAIVPLFHKGFFVSDDGDGMIIRLSAFHQALVHGQFPVRILPRLNFEYGYPVSNFLYPGFMYLAEPFHILKFSFVTSIKIMLGLTMIGSAVFAYLWLSKVFTRFSGVIGALVYLYSSYHFFDIYQRGSVGEVLALMLVPFIFWSIERRTIVLSGIGIALLILSHNTLAALFLPVLFLYAVLRSELKLYLQATTFLLGVGIATFFWFPALYDLQYTVFSQTKISDWQHYFADSKLIGWGSISILLVSSAIFIVKKIYPKAKFFENKSHFLTRKNSFLLVLFLVIGLFSLILSSGFSTVLWQFLPISFIQFPFRLLSLLIVVSAFLSAYVLFACKNTYLRIGFIGLFVILAFFDAYPHVRSIEYTDKGEGFYATNEDTTTIKNEYMPKWIKEFSSQRPTELITKTKDTTISNEVNTINTISFTTDGKKSGTVTINKIYFPGWIAKIDNKAIPIVYSNSRGLISFPVPQGQHNVTVAFRETGIHLMSDIVSLLCLITLMVVWFGKNKKV